MKELKERILKDVKVIGSEILKVDSFLNHQIDTDLLDKIGKYASDRYKPIVIEDVDLYRTYFKHNKDKTTQRKLNKALHSLPYSKFKDFASYLKVVNIKAQPTVNNRYRKLRINIHLTKSAIKFQTEAATIA